MPFGQWHPSIHPVLQIEVAPFDPQTELHEGPHSKKTLFAVHCTAENINFRMSFLVLISNVLLWNNKNLNDT